MQMYLPPVVLASRSLPIKENSTCKPLVDLNKLSLTYTLNVTLSPPIRTGCYELAWAELHVITNHHKLSWLTKKKKALFHCVIPLIHTIKPIWSCWILSSQHHSGWQRNLYRMLSICSETYSGLTFPLESSKHHFRSHFLSQTERHIAKV